MLGFSTKNEKKADWISGTKEGNAPVCFNGYDVTVYTQNSVGHSYGEDMRPLALSDAKRLFKENPGSKYVLCAKVSDDGWVAVAVVDGTGYEAATRVPINGDPRSNVQNAVDNVLPPM